MSTQETPDYSKDAIPAGTIVITRGGWEDNLYTVEDLQYMREVNVGQLFRAVARYYNKSKKDYGNLWPRAATPLGEISKAYKLIESEIMNQRNDYDKLVMVCAQLGEDVPMMIETNQETNE
ncbi:hypothetical protein NVP2275O_186 [Vibrio phage 2.275.O._10N.286.54.E11]|nr:hypothetical protein NVP2275O_186 [Vibrio phage 2.275.O._10N.286.54.E11]